MRLGVNIDHVATLREQRTEGYPDVCEAAKICLESGADLITIHLREDRRHIQKQDVYDLRNIVPLLNLEMALSDEMFDLAKAIKPDWLCLVPEKRSELTTEGGLNIEKYQHKLKKTIPQLQQEGINVSLFIEPEKEAIKHAKTLNADAIELHTGAYANAIEPKYELNRLEKAVEYARSINIQVHAGHGLNLENLSDILAIKGIEELNIGHSIISRALFVGLKESVCELKKIIDT